LQRRKDLGMRGAGEKAQKPDEWLTRSQIVPGTNITFDYLTNWDIVINAHIGAGSAFTQRRMLTGTVILDKFHANAFYSTSPDLHIAADDKDNGAAGDRRYYGTGKYFDIVHNWELSPINSYLCTLEDIRIGFSSPLSFDSWPKVVGIDKNTIRIIATDALDIDFTNISDSTWDTVSGSTTMTCDSTTQYSVGMTLAGTGVPDNTRITGITNTTTVVVNNAATATGTNINVTASKWPANEDTKLTGNLKAAYSHVSPRYRFTLQEYTD